MSTFRRGAWCAAPDPGRLVEHAFPDREVTMSLAPPSTPPDRLSAERAAAPSAEHAAPGPPSVPDGPLSRTDAERLGSRIQDQAARIAEATCELLLMVGEFDARGGLSWFVGLKSTAHWLAWACSMSAGTAREHVRIARVLPTMPRTLGEFRAGRLSFSKVREMTRVAGRIDEDALVELARDSTASQLARAISSFRAADGSRLDQEMIREARWPTRDDGMVELRAVLPAEVGAEVTTALELAMARDGHDDAPAATTVTPDARNVPPTAAGQASGEATSTDRADAEVTTTATLEQRRADALLDVARGYLAAAPDDRSGEDRHVVVVQVSADALSRDVPAGTSQRCSTTGGGPLETRTAERLACTGKVSVAITDTTGEVLHLGRSRRLASRAQRRALRLRDETCVFPGCHQSRHLDAHHVTPWSEGGRTDIDGLALLCRRHHVIVHEGGLRLQPLPASAAGLSRFTVVDAEDRPVQARWPAMLERVRTRPSPGVQGDEAGEAAEAGKDDGHDTPPPGSADPRRIAARTGGQGFSLSACVDALCQNVVTLAA
ncbi:DUF222 domain-containing protein [Brachybacterium sp. GCM10030252]|uniref:HNH endonuclease signature motif containing protein n=1 Tax=Brachybacterium sp. GCM10030252 TaxID=3273380 RepID=UPI0036235CCB